MALKIQCQKTGKMKTIKIGSNSDKKAKNKCVEGTRGVTCDSDAGNKRKRLKKDNHDDEFDITVSNNEVCATRKGNTKTWGLDLKIKCAKDAEVIRPLSNMETCVTVSEGKLMSEQALVVESCVKTEAMKQFFIYDEGTKQIKLLNSPGLCFNGKGEKGTPIKTMGCGDGDDDEWLLQDNKIKAKKSQMCVGVEKQALILTDCSEINTSFHVTGKEKMDCPWKKPNEHDWMPTCEDGTPKPSYDCVLQKHGQRIKCPKKLPVMCNAKRCGGDHDFCCEATPESCEEYGGVRSC